MKQHGIFIFTSPSCSGKSSLEARMNDTGLFSKTTSVTTRPMRPGEKDGVDYHFVTKEHFQELDEASKLVESVCFNNNFYGVTKSELQSHLELGKHTLIVCEPHGAKEYRNYALNNGFVPINVFVDCPLDVCSSRFFSRLQNENILDGEGKLNQTVIKRYAERFSVMSLEEQDWINQIPYDLHTKPMIDFETAHDFADQLIGMAKEMDLGIYNASKIEPMVSEIKSSIIPQFAIDKNIATLSTILNNALSKDFSNEKVGQMVSQTRATFFDKMVNNHKSIDQCMS